MKPPSAFLFLFVLENAKKTTGALGAIAQIYLKQTLTTFVAFFSLKTD